MKITIQIDTEGQIKDLRDHITWEFPEVEPNTEILESLYFTVEKITSSKFK